MNRYGFTRLARVTSVLGAALFVLGLGTARADIIVKDPTVTNSVSNPGAFTWTYDVTNDEEIDTAHGTNFFTIYDFAGFIPGSNFQPSGWVFSSSNVGLTPPHITVTDNPAIPNLTWTYTGAEVNGPQDLGNFGADSTIGTQKVGSFATEAVKNSPGHPADETPVDNVGSVGVPNSVIPESSSLLLLLPGLAPLGVLLRKRRG